MNHDVSMTVQGFRVALAFGQRNAQVWGMRRIARHSLQAIGEHFGVTKERVRQLVKKADDLLASWPVPNAWQATLGPRLRELAALHDLTTIQELADAVTRMRDGARLRGFSDEDLRAAAAIARVQLTSVKVADEVARVTAAIGAVSTSIAWLESQGVVGAAQVRAGADVLLKYGARLFRAADDDAAAIAAAPTGEDENG